MTVKKPFFYYKIKNDSIKEGGLKLEIWCRKTRSNGTSFLVRTLPSAFELNDFLKTYDSAMLLKDSLEKALEKVMEDGKKKIS